MKLVIDIPDNEYSQICELRLHNRTFYDDAIRNGTPLNEVLDKIRAEIEALIGEYNIDDYDFCTGLICARRIIDKYRKEQE